jgi:POT family proton-dependent oligopeptide transporter
MTQGSDTPNPAIPSHADTAFFGHPKGLLTLFLTEMWERMSYYGMRGFLILFMTTAIMGGGLEFDDATATAIYGLYTGSVYFTGLAGGWIADRLIGSQKAVWYGGILIMCGHLVLAIPSTNTFFIGLIFIVLGTGLLKPNITAMVGGLYESGDERRDAGYTLYYMGINIGSIIGYLGCGFMAEKVGWHWGFGLAALGMAIGLVQYRFTILNLKGVGAEPVVRLQPKAQTISWGVIAAFLLAVVCVTAAMMFGSLTINAVTLAGGVATVILTVFVLSFAAIFLFGNLSSHEKKRVTALLLICIASACFWSGFEQAGSSLNLFAERFTDRVVAGWEVPTSWFQLANSVILVVISPFMAALWINLGKRMLDPSYGIKCAIGLVIMGSGFIVMFYAAHSVASNMKAAPYFLIMTYFLHTVGELCLSPVALSAVSKLAPKRFTGQLMGVFILTYSIGSIIAGLVAGRFDPEKIEQMPGLYMNIFIFCALVGVGVFLFSLVTRKWEKYAESDGI